jgi:predicted TIM-barrel fold metal-dependent hydrolase
MMTSASFASIDPHKGRMGAREARDLVENCGVKGFKSTISCRLRARDQMAYPIYEIINHYKLPAIFHTGHSGMGTGMRGGGVRLNMVSRCWWMMWRSIFPI